MFHLLFYRFRGSVDLYVHDTPVEEELTNMVKVLAKYCEDDSSFIVLLSNFDCKLSPFSGGRDIMFFFHEKGSFAIQTRSFRFASPNDTDEDELKFAF